MLSLREYVQLVFLGTSRLSEHVLSIIEIASHFHVTPFTLPFYGYQERPIGLLTFIYMHKVFKEYR